MASTLCTHHISITIHNHRAQFLAAVPYLITNTTPIVLLSAPTTDQSPSCSIAAPLQFSTTKHHPHLQLKSPITSNNHITIRDYPNTTTRRARGQSKLQQVPLPAQTRRRHFLEPVLTSSNPKHPVLLHHHHNRRRRSNSWQPSAQLLNPPYRCISRHHKTTVVFLAAPQLRRSLRTAPPTPKLTGASHITVDPGRDQPR